MEKKILIIYNNSKYSGNYFTGKRIKSFFKNACLHNVNDECYFDHDYIIAIHLIKCTSFLEKTNKPFSVIMAGTDCLDDTIVNKNYLNIINKAEYVITFNKFMEKRINNLYYIFDNIKIIPQAVDIKYKKEEIKYNDYFIWIGKLRKIKSPELLFKIALERLDLKFIMIGEKDENYNNIVFPNNVIYLNKLGRNTVLNYLINSNGLINTSLEEGMSDTILTAMAFNIPVFAKNNTGNKSIIKNKINGFLFNNIFELNTQINTFSNIRLNSLDYIKKNHLLINEKNMYINLIN